MESFYRHYNKISNDKNKLVEEYFIIIQEILSFLSKKDKIIHNYQTTKKDMSFRQSLSIILKKIKNFRRSSRPKVLKTILNSLNYYYDKLSELQYCLSKLEPNEEVKYEFDNKKEITTNAVVDRFAQNWLNRLQFRYITPITVRLSEFDSKHAKFRDYWVFGISFFGSIAVSLVISWNFDKNNDIDLEKFKTLSTRNQDSIKVLIENQNNDIKQSFTILEHNDSILDHNIGILDSIVSMNK